MFLQKPVTLWELLTTVLPHTQSTREELSTLQPAAITRNLLQLKCTQATITSTESRLAVFHLPAGKSAVPNRPISRGRRWRVLTRNALLSASWRSLNGYTGESLGNVSEWRSEVFYSDWGFSTLTEIFLNLTKVFLTLTEVFSCFFLSCKANARVKLAKTGHGPHSSTLVCICVVRMLFFVLFVG